MTENFDFIPIDKYFLGIFIIKIDLILANIYIYLKIVRPENSLKVSFTTFYNIFRSLNFLK